MDINNQIAQIQQDPKLRSCSIIVVVLFLFGVLYFLVGSEEPVGHAFEGEKKANVAPPKIVCGDGKKHPSEQCDFGQLHNDGDASGSDTSYVPLSAPRYGEADKVAYSCDSCTLTQQPVSAPGCGDMVTQIEYDEQCDDGNEDDTDSCNSCRLSTCGDGIPQSPNDLGQSEQCDDGNQENTDACTNRCRNALCGDTFVQAGVEECDTGSTNGYLCTPEPGSSCTYCSSTCTAEVFQGLTVSSQVRATINEYGKSPVVLMRDPCIVTTSGRQCVWGLNLHAVSLSSTKTYQFSIQSSGGWKISGAYLRNVDTGQRQTFSCDSATCGSQFNVQATGKYELYATVVEG